MASSGVSSCGERMRTGRRRSASCRRSTAVNSTGSAPDFGGGDSAAGVCSERDVFVLDDQFGIGSSHRTAAAGGTHTSIETGTRFTNPSFHVGAAFARGVAALIERIARGIDPAHDLLAHAGDRAGHGILGGADGVFGFVLELAGAGGNALAQLASRAWREQ